VSDRLRSGGQQCPRKRILATKRYFSQYGLSLHYVETSNPGRWTYIPLQTLPVSGSKLQFVALLSDSEPLVRISIAKCFTNSNKRFLCEVMFDSEHTFVSCLHIYNWTAFAQMACPAVLENRVLLTRVWWRRLDDVLHRCGPAQENIFVPWYMTDLGCVSNDTLCNIRWRLTVVKIACYIHISPLLLYSFACRLHFFINIVALIKASLMYFKTCFCA
jgi:hypothetical protein